MTTSAKTTPVKRDGTDQGRVFEAIAKADKGDATALDVLRDVFRDVPADPAHLPRLPGIVAGRPHQIAGARREPIA